MVYYWRVRYWWETCWPLWETGWLSLLLVWLLFPENDRQFSANKIFRRSSPKVEHVWVTQIWVSWLAFIYFEIFHVQSNKIWFSGCKTMNAICFLFLKVETCAGSTRYASIMDRLVIHALFLNVKPYQKSKIGKLKTQWDGLPDNKFSSQTCYGLVFPKDLDIEHKNLLIGAAFLMVCTSILFQQFMLSFRVTIISA